MHGAWVCGPSRQCDTIDVWGGGGWPALGSSFCVYVCGGEMTSGACSSPRGRMWGEAAWAGAVREERRAELEREGRYCPQAASFLPAGRTVEDS